MAFARSRLVRVLLVLTGLFVIAGAAGWVAFYVAFLRDLPELRSLRDYRPPLASHVLDRRGQPIGLFYDERRTLVSLDELPRHAVLAFVASEDGAFFEHQGLDYASILRAAWVNIRAGGHIRQGGSTITQQVAKTLLLSPERHVVRKIKDMLLARRIEKHFSKEEILYLYLNQIYFGDGAYGIGEAARSYFGKHASELTVSESALLAGLPKAPSAYSPYTNPEAAERRRQYVLGRMFEEGFINEATFEAAKQVPPTLASPPDLEDFRVAAYFTEEVRRELFDALGGEAVRRDGLRIETTLDLDLQRSAVRALQNGLQALDRRQGYRGPVRRVAAEDIAHEVETLAQENGFQDAEGSEGVAPPPTDRVLLGVVVEVEKEFAHVALAPGVSGVVELEDVTWAREPDVSHWPQAVRSVKRVFAVGDVVRVTRKAPTDGEDSSGEGLRLLVHQEPLVQGALVSMEVDSGDVLSLVGGYDFESSEFNRAIQAHRQPGSAFKPIIYGAALSQGYTPASIVVDRPVVYDDPTSGFTWRPENYERRFMGPLTLRTALAQSVNSATIHLLRDVGVGRVVEFAHALGIESTLERNLSLALGVSNVTLLELTRAYMVFPAGGRRVRPRFIARVLDRDGNVLLENLSFGDGSKVDVAARLEAEQTEPTFEDPSAEEPAAAPAPAASAQDQVLGPVPAYLMTDMLRGVVIDPHGTGRRARELSRTIGAKTGTTNDQGDAWFVGFSPTIATGVWVGFDERQLLGKGETGARAALPIWVEYMRTALADRPNEDFLVPEGIVFARIDRKTGLLVSPESKETYFQAFSVGTEPTESTEGTATASESDRLLRLDAF